MRNPPEELLHYIWQHRLLRPGSLRTVSGQPLRIVSRGTLNHNSGPDFFNATLMIGGVMLSGNVEIHVKTSDWSRHRHEADRAYDHIILHVVYEHDGNIEQNTAHNVEVLELKDHLDAELMERYEKLAGAPHAIPCGKQLPGVENVVVLSWLDRMAAERIEYKQQKFDRLVREFHGDYGQALYTSLMQSFGFNVNSVPFELIARLVPLKILLRHADNPVHLEAMLAGTAGLLSEQLNDRYLQLLQNEYVFLQRKYRLVQLRQGVLKLSRMRPANFPGLRLAQVAAIIHKHPELFSDPCRFTGYDALMDILKTPVSLFWKHHYNPQGAYVGNELNMGTLAAESIVINVFSPFIFYCGKKFGKAEYVSRAVELLERCRAEDNRKTRLFGAKKSLLTSALYSQAAIQLADRYCSEKKCLRCAIGNQIISPKNAQVPVRVR